jgi:hypothetical protein
MAKIFFDDQEMTKAERDRQARAGPIGPGMFPRGGPDGYNGFRRK